MPIRVLIADDHAVVREGLRALLQREADIDVVDVADDGRQTVKRALELQPDVLVMDIAMPNLNGLEATRRIRAESPSIQVVILSMHATEEFVYRALQAGALGYLLKESASVEVADAVRAVHQGSRYFSPRISDMLVGDYLHLRQDVGESPLESLSNRERDVLQLVVEGHTSAEIGQRLSISSKTVDTYRSRLMKKLGVKDLPELVKFAIQHGLTSLE